MSASNIVGTSYIYSDAIGSVGNMTWEQLQEMQAAGWSIGNHSKSHVDLTTLTQAQAEAELSGCDTDLIAHGLTGGKQVAYPFGQRNATVDAAMTASGMLTGRLVDGANFDPATVTHYQLSAYSVYGSVTLEQTKIRINSAVTGGLMCVLVLHDISDTPSGNGWTAANFQALITWLASYGVECINIEDVYGLM